MTNYQKVSAEVTTILKTKKDPFAWMCACVLSNSLRCGECPVEKYCADYCGNCVETIYEFMLTDK